MNKNKSLLIFVFLLSLFALYVSLPSTVPLKVSWGKINFDLSFSRPPLNFNLGPFHFQRDLEIRKGLDLAGGAHLVFRADMAQIAPSDRQTALASAKDIISRRVDLFGLSEASVRTSKINDDYRILVELAGVTELDEAIDLIGQTAQLDFLLVNESTESGSLFEETALSGQYLKKADPAFNPQTGQPVIDLEFTPEGGQIFADITAANIGRRLAILLDEAILMAPQINEAITAGKAQINGEFTVNEAKKFAAQLNGGALPIPFEIIEQKNIGPTLGEVSIQKSTRAGLIGLGFVILFMILYYHWLGFLSSVGLVIYGLLTLALYKLIPVTLTLPGIAGFLLTIGMAVDSNILIFERIKEETRSGQPFFVARELGFGRAWDSIRDANVCTLITCFILFNPFDWSFLNSSGLVRGFALTLGVGSVLSLFTGVIVSRVLLQTFTSSAPPAQGKPTRRSLFRKLTIKN